jgi:restriction system protein
MWGLAMMWKVQVPTFDQLTLPLLQLVGDGAVHALRDVIDELADHLELTDDQRNELLPSGRKTRFEDRASWAATYLKKAGLLESAGWGKVCITQRGVDVLRSGPTHINRRFLMQFPEFRTFINGKHDTPEAVDYGYIDMTPHDLMQTAYLGIRQDLADDLLDIVLSGSPAFFERLVVDVLLAMGYGSSHASASRTVGRSGDGGIDGYIQEDKLGLDTIYIQAKRWTPDRPVGRPEIQAFVGSLIGVKGKKGVFITTSRFTQEAVEYTAGVSEVKVILMDGAELTRLMMEHEVGVVTERHYVVQMVDHNYFDLE